MRVGDEDVIDAGELLHRFLVRVGGRLEPRVDQDYPARRRFDAKRRLSVPVHLGLGSGSEAGKRQHDREQEPQHVFSSLKKTSRL
jgi:hypothetical protein